MRQVSGRVGGGVSDGRADRWNRNTNHFPFTGIQALMGK